MVFSSIPVYLDPPNWQQQANHPQQGGSNENSNIHQLPPLLPPAAALSGGGAGPIRPNSMANHARLAKIPPEAALKCPRCESTNTKFCYYNNYSLSQPRHFCKTCRRYWTKGGALRNVPVGGGCRRNKKNRSSSGNSSKPNPVSANNINNKQMGSASSDQNGNIIPGHLQHEIPQFPFMASLQNFTSQYNMGNLGLAFGGGIHQSQMTTSDVGFNSSTGGMQQFHQMFDHTPLTTSNLYQYHHQNNNEGGEVRTTSSLVGEDRDQVNHPRVSQVAPVKMEEIRGVNLSKLSFVGVNPESPQYWSGNNWTDLSSPGLN